MRWRSWLEDERGVTTLDELNVLDCRRYARHLKRRSRDSELKASTATTYYAYVRAFLSFCIADEFLDISHQALSERIRRGNHDLIKNALLVDENEDKPDGNHQD